MAADLKRRGIYHGKRTTVSHVSVPKPDVMGSAAYRRRQAKLGKGSR